MPDSNSNSSNGSISSVLFVDWDRTAFKGDARDFLKMALGPAVWEYARRAPVKKFISFCNAVRRLRRLAEKYEKTGSESTYTEMWQVGSEALKGMPKRAVDSATDRFAATASSRLDLGVLLPAFRYCDEGGTLMVLSQSFESPIRAVLERAGRTKKFFSVIANPFVYDGNGSEQRFLECGSDVHFNKGGWIRRIMDGEESAVARLVQNNEEYGSMAEEGKGRYAHDLCAALRRVDKRKVGIVADSPVFDGDGIKQVRSYGGKVYISPQASFDFKQAERRAGSHVIDNPDTFGYSLCRNLLGR